jgi:WD40 repeat protein
MKGKELIPMPYNFGEKFRPEKPLLSQDGSMLIFEKSVSAGKFYLYSADGKHRLVGEGGSVSSAAISPDGKLVSIISADYLMQVYNVNDGSLYKCIALAESKPKRDYGPMRNKINKIFADKPKYILNR